MMTNEEIENAMKHFVVKSETEQVPVEQVVKKPAKQRPPTQRQTDAIWKKVKQGKDLSHHEDRIIFYALFGHFPD